MQVIFNGLVAGAAIGLLGTAFGVAYNTTGVFHLALGGVYILAPFIAWAVTSAGGSPLLAVGIALIAATVTSLSCEVFSHWKLHRSGAGAGSQMVASMGIYIVLVQSVALVWGVNGRSLRTAPDFVIARFPIEVTFAQFVVLAVSSVSAGVFVGWLSRTGAGVTLRALATDPEQIMLWGHNERRLRTLAFAVAGALTGLCALAGAYESGFDPTTGMRSLLLGVVAMVIGGKESVWGAMLGGLLVGLLRSLVLWHAPAAWQDPAVFALLAWFLLVRPQGLLGRSHRVEAY